MKKLCLSILLLLIVSCQNNSFEVITLADLKLPLPMTTEDILSGASGIIKQGNSYFVIRDNSNQLYQFKEKDFAWTKSFAIFDGKLPNDKKDRKRLKPDLEAMVIIPDAANSKQKSLLLVPSGSKRNRIKGALLHFSENGDLSPQVTKVDFTPLYYYLEKILHKVNIEGAVVMDEQLLLFHRGNTKKTRNAIIYLQLKCLLSPSEKIIFKPECIENFAYPELGSKENIPYAFTDAMALNASEILFLAAGEETDDPARDGYVSGSILGIMSKDGKVKWSKPFKQKSKFEGLTLSNESSDSELKLILVSDADNDNKPSSFYQVIIKK